MYKCFDCGKEIDPNTIRRRVRCIYCGSKVIFKKRLRSTEVKAR